MVNIFIFHGVGGHPKENWFAWLKQELEKLGHTVLIPQFPTPEKQTLSNWLSVLDNYQEFLNRNSILIGHSLGVPFLLNVLETHLAKAAFLVSGFTGKAGNKFDESMKTFAQREFNWNQIKKNCKRFSIFHSDNDPYISLAKAQELAQNLDVNVILVKGAGHFNEAAGYTTFPLLLEKIKQL